MALTLAIPLRHVFRLHEFITARHLDNMAKIMLACGLVVAYSYACGDGVPDCYANQITYNGTVVQFYWESRPDPVTYADRVDIVAHSKGGLVSRQYLYSYPAGANRIRRLVMCASLNPSSRMRA